MFLTGSLKLYIAGNIDIVFSIKTLTFTGKAAEMLLIAFVWCGVESNGDKHPSFVNLYHLEED